MIWMPQLRIAVDSGHGSGTAGKRTIKLTKDIGRFKKGEQVREHWICTHICKMLHDNLVGMGYAVVKSAWDDGIVTDDSDLPLANRQKLIKNARCDYSVSIHLNAYGDGIKYNSANGIEVLIHNDPTRVGDSYNMARYVLTEMLKGTKQKNRGVKTQALAMCNCKNLGVKGAILCECAFMTNQYEVETMITQEDFWRECAGEIADGINKYILSTLTVPTSTISKTSSENDVKWLQIKANKALKALGSKTVLKVDGSYGTKTVNGVLELWKLLGWNKDSKDTGEKAGAKTITKLNEF
jgi:N-acetylmuramoyl-L-alanine amidase